MDLGSPATKSFGLYMAGPLPGPAGVLPAAVGPLAAPVAVAGYRRSSLGLPLAGLFWLAFGWTVALAWGKLWVWGRL
jgi:hypothetical protein